MPKKSPVFMVFIASSLFGFTAILTKLLIATITPVGVLAFRFMFLILTFPIILQLLGKTSFKELISVNKEEFKHFFVLSFLLVADMVLFFQALYYIDVNKAILLFLTYPIMSLLLAHLFLKERITFTDITATLLSLLGVAVMFLNKINIKSDAFLGEAMVLLSALLWAGYIVMNRYSVTTSHYKKTYWIFLLNSAMLLPLFFAYGKPATFFNVTLYHLALLLIISIFSTLIPYTLLSYTAPYVKSSTSSIVLLLGPIIGVFLSFIVLKETPQIKIIFGGLLILISAFISTYSIERLFLVSKNFAKRIKTILFGY
ncbi:DMT family transporter [Candidatus Woesearchaeota archaeon]|nr:DMT family transporter [Candidatus Woesearchaeota archaeon]